MRRTVTCGDFCHPTLYIGKKRFTKLLAANDRGFSAGEIKTTVKELSCLLLDLYFTN
jgi:hypothetical protein